MKGVVFNLLEEVVVDAYGEDLWDQLLADSALQGAYTSLGSYPDSNMQELVAVAAKHLNLTPFEVFRWFGRSAMPFLFERYPGFFAAQESTRSFLLSVNSIIHPEVRKVYPGAQVPTFDFNDDASGGLLMGYHSPRRLCALAQGFTEGAAAHYGERITFEHLECMHHNDKQCLCRIRFLSNGAL